MRKYATLRHLQSPHVTREEKILCLGDKLSNLRATARDCKLLGTQYWERFNQKDPRAIKWYYVGVGEALQELYGCDAYREYLALLACTFKDYEDLSDEENPTPMMFCFSFHDIFGEDTLSDIIAFEL
jgi:myo-inositol-1(or 4)-monophosphatase